MADKVNELPPATWTPACDAEKKVRDGARVAEPTGMLNLPTWQAGMRVIVRAERRHPGAAVAVHGPGRELT
jgi:hypothetical protein